MNEQTFRNMLVFLNRATANGVTEARALCECVDALNAMLAATAQPAPPTPPDDKTPDTAPTSADVPAPVAAAASNDRDDNVLNFARAAKRA